MADKTSQGNELLDQLTSDSRQTRQIARRRMIAEAVMTEGSMRIEDLTDRFGISLMTAHRDVDELVSRGLFRKTRGIVTAAATNLIESSDVYRSNRQAAEKRLIAEAAMQFVEPGQAIFFDDSTTVLQMVPHLASRVPVTVITNSLTLMNALTGMSDVTLLALGGQYSSWCNAFMGRMTLREINALRADVFFVSMSAINNGMVLHQTPETVDVKRAMFDCSVKRILLADHTKFEARALHSFAALDEFDAVIVDDGTDPIHIDRMQASDINVVVARRNVKRASEGR